VEFGHQRMTALFNVPMVCAAKRELLAVRVRRVVVAVLKGLSVEMEVAVPRRIPQVTVLTPRDQGRVSRARRVSADLVGLAMLHLANASVWSVVQSIACVERTAVQRDRPVTTANVAALQGRLCATAPVAPPANATAVLYAVRKDRLPVGECAARAVRVATRVSAGVLQAKRHAEILAALPGNLA
jgi:hypothetical protein